MKRWLPLFFIFLSTQSMGQLLSWSPTFPTKDSNPITITMDATKGNQGLLGHAPGDVYVHIGVITNKSTDGGNWRYVSSVWGTTVPAYKATSLGNNKWSFTITGGLRTYFGVNDATEIIQKIAILFRSGDGSDKQTNEDNSDMYIPVYSSNLAVRFSAPLFQPTYEPKPETITKNIGDAITVTGISNQAAILKIFLNGTEIQNAAAATTITASPALVSGGSQEVVVRADDGTTTVSDTFNLFVSGSVNIAPLPAGVRNGINYISNTSATLVLYAPNKGRVAVIGDFPGNNWTEQSTFQMNKTTDGKTWWITLTGLTPGEEYSYQYLVNGVLKIGDPYCEKILDPFNDQYISSSTYPNLKPYPTGKTTGVVSELQTDAPQYNWDVTNFSKPDKHNLIIYELLLRDFVANHDWNTLRDTLNYLKKLGINAIEVMPFNEFEGNLSWGYNPDYYFAPDKYYGPANTLKEFIDSCHKNGIAVIMDIALNHSFGMSPLVQLYWDAGLNRPAADNPWFNPVAKHAFNVGYDMNHESKQTHYYVGRILGHWIQDYKIDGFRFDLSKGFTQNQTCDDNGQNCNVAEWGNYDPTRVKIWEGYYDTLKNYSADAYCILEHFAANSEETVLANDGMMLWGNENYNYNEATMGYPPDWDFSKALANQRGWSEPNLVSYMESHDEERLMFKNINYGKASGTYNIKDTATALKRQELAAAFFFTLPGPKMFWQFGELGYDYSINYCQDGSNNSDCRTDPKPIRWDYFQQAGRREIYNTYSNLIRLRKDPAFRSTFTSNSSDQSLGGAFKWIKLDGTTGKVVVVGNFDVVAQGGDVIFPATGIWYDYLNGTTLNVTTTSQHFNLQPGAFRVFTNIKVTLPVTLISFDGSHKGDFNVLTWKVENEKSLAYYEVESGTDGIHFSPIAKVAAEGHNVYSWSDGSVYSSTIVYYRLKTVDYDGGMSYSRVVAIKEDLTSFSPAAQPNPFTGTLKLVLQAPVPGQANITLIGMDGRRLFTEKRNVTAGKNVIKINESAKLSAGTYLLQLRMGDKRESIKIVKTN